MNAVDLCLLLGQQVGILKAPRLTEPLEALRAGYSVFK